MRAIESDVRDIPEDRERPSGHTDGPVVVIFNPEARAAKAGEITAEALENACRAHGMQARIAPCDSEERSAAIVAEAVRTGARAVVAVGGDGTVHAIARALMEAGRQGDGGANGVTTALGIVPLGTMNNIACGLGIPEDLDGAIDAIAAGHTRPLDLGSADGQPFIEVAGAGLIADLFPIMEAVKGRPWMLPAALWRASRTLRQFHSTRVTLLLNGRRLRPRAMQITVCNTPIHGAKFELAPGARLDDGQLDIVVFTRIRPLALLWHMALAAGGRHVGHPGIRRFRAAEVSIAPAAPWPLQLDGQELDTCGAGTERPVLTLRALPHALQVLAPPEQACDPATQEGLLRTVLRATPAPPQALTRAATAVGEKSKEAVRQVVTPPVPPSPAAVEPPRKAARRAGWLRSLYFVGLIAMIAASLAARKSGILPGDLAITRAIQRRRTPARDLFFTAVAEPGFPPWGGVGVLLPAALFWRARLRLEALFMLLGGGTDAVNFVIKRVVCRKRPADPLVRVVRIIREPSFPSGHVMHYLATFGFLAAAAVANLRPSRLRRAVVAACAAMIALVGPSRVYLGAHWPSDVGAGYVCGGLYLGGMLELYAWAKRHQAEEHEAEHEERHGEEDRAEHPS